MPTLRRWIKFPVFLPVNDLAKNDSDFFRSGVLRWRSPQSHHSVSFAQSQGARRMTENRIKKGRAEKTKRCICGGRDPCCWWVACRTRPSQIHRLGVSRCAEGGSADTLQGKVSEV